MSQFRQNYIPEPLPVVRYECTLKDYLVACVIGCALAVALVQWWTT
jgi:hypothetical protein